MTGIIANIIVAGIILAAVILAGRYIYKAKKSGKKCIGCPYCGQCSGGQGGHGDGPFGLLHNEGGCKNS